MTFFDKLCTILKKAIQRDVDKVKEQKNTQDSAKEKPICFVIMPISDPEGYKEGHFKKIYDQIFKPAIEECGYKPLRADEDSSSNLIQAKIINRLLDAPLVLCDLSSLNPNVLFELGLRQAFDKPVVLVQEEGTKRIFDIGNITTIDYRQSRVYDEVIQDQEKISCAINETIKDSHYNSLVSLLKITSAKIDDNNMTNEDLTAISLVNISRQIDQLNSKMENISEKNIKTFNTTDEKNYLDDKYLSKKIKQISLLITINREMPDFMNNKNQIKQKLDIEEILNMGGFQLIKIAWLSQSEIELIFREPCNAVARVWLIEHLHEYFCYRYSLEKEDVLIRRI